MNTIVVGYDASEPADRALERAADLAKAFSAKLVVTSVAPIFVGRSGPVDQVDPPEDHQEELGRAEEVPCRAWLAGGVRPRARKPRRSHRCTSPRREARISSSSARESRT